MLASPAFSAQLLHPRYWPTWLGFGLWWLIAQLPYSWQMAMGARLGRLLARLAPRRRAIAARNIELCFPQLSVHEQNRLVDGVMDSIGKAIFETGMAWFLPRRRLRKLLTLQALEYLEQPRAAGQGVVLVALHFTHLEMGAAAVSMQSPIDGTYLVAVTNEGRMLVFPVNDLPVLPKGKGNKIIGIPSDRLIKREEFLAGLAVINSQTSVKIHSGKRHITLALKDMEHYMGERGRKGNKLPRGFQLVDWVETV